RATQQALLEAHEYAFNYFGGVFRTVRYDNMTSVVKKILRGRQRVETERIIAFRWHWGYRSEYCNPAKGNEKGGVEGELGWFRRNYLTPGSGGGESGVVERAVAGHVLRGAPAHDTGEERVCDGDDAAGMRASVAACRRRLRPGRGGRCAGGGWPRTREGEVQLVLSAGLAGSESKSGGMAIADRDQSRWAARGATRTLLRTRSTDTESRTLSGCTGEKAGSDERLDTVAAMASGRALAGMPGPRMAAVGEQARKEQGDARDDCAGAGGIVGWVGAADRGGGRSVAHRGERRRGGAAHTAHAGSTAAPPLRRGAGRGTGAVRASDAGEGRIRPTAPPGSRRASLRSQAGGLASD